MRKIAIFVILAMTVVAGYNLPLAAASDTLVEKYCVGCHSTAIVYGKKKPQEMWDKTFDRMMKHAKAKPSSELNKATDDEIKQLKEFLYTLKR